MERNGYPTVGVLFLVLCVASCAFSQTSTAPSGSGTSGDPYQIASLANLYWVTQNSTSWNSHFLQTADIDATPDTGWDSEQGFTPIGNNTTNFKGTYDGGGHSITNLYINRSSTYYVGLFGYTSSATIENISLKNVNVTGHVGVGGLIGDATYGTVTNCSSSGSVTGSYFYDGSNYGSYVGGLIGGSAYETVSRSYSTVNANGQTYIAGFVGYADVGSVFENCFCTGSVSCQYSHFGGFGGSMVSCTLTNCYATGNVGGSYGSVYAAGFAGDVSSVTLTNCYSTGGVSGTNYIGGFTGFDNGSSVTSCFWNTDNFGGSSADGTGMTTIQMNAPETFINAGWTFSTSGWAMYGAINNGYPYLPGVTQFSTPAPSTLYALTGSATNIKYTTATLNGIVNAGGDTTVVRFLYGTTPASYTDSVTVSSSPLVPWDSIQVSASLSGLKSGSTFYCCVSATKGTAYLRGDQVSFATLLATRPTVTTDFQFTAQYTTAAVNGFVNPNGDTATVRFLYGVAAGVYTDSVLASPGRLIVADSVSATLTGLTPNQIYYYRISAVNDSGYSRGSELSLHTKQPPQLATVPGTALSFNSGSSQYVSVPDNASLRLTDSLTLEAWVYPTGSGNMTVIDKGNYNYCFEIRPNGQSGLGLYNAAWGWIYSGGTVPLNQWSHIAVVFQTGTNGVKFYLNGSLLSQNTASGALTTNTGEFAIGKQAPGNCDCNFFQGKIDEVRVWGVPRTQQQIRESMHRTLTGTEKGLISYWQFNEGSGTVAADSIGGNHGTLINGPAWITSTAPFGGGQSSSLFAVSTDTTASLSGVSAAFTNAFDNQSDLTATEILAAPDSLPTGSGTVLADRYWAIDVFGTPGTYSANLTFTVPSSFTNSGAANASSYTLYQRGSVNDGAWAPVMTGASSVTDSTVSFSGISSLGQFSIGTDDPLPVQLASFTATSDRLSAELTWKTATEVSSSSFSVERRLTNNDQSTASNGQWIAVGSVAGSGSSNAPKVYSFVDKNLSAGKYSYRLKQIDRNGAFTYSQEVSVDVGAAPRVLDLSQNFPNPFNPSTNIQFTIPVDGRTTLRIYNTLGQEVATLFDGTTDAGEYHQVTFDGSRLASGIYFSRLEFNGKMMVKKMLLLK
ncbi:MAG TPA: LamG-like jellyroll fold domain-containing protein [Bacteroidota bacterium]|nr:LamG-like jellyroll fold domain-containing protein [Bacteroidota bacterium]